MILRCLPRSGAVCSAARLRAARSRRPPDLPVPAGAEPDRVEQLTQPPFDHRHRIVGEVDDVGGVAGRVDGHTLRTAPDRGGVGVGAGLGASSASAVGESDSDVSTEPTRSWARPRYERSSSANSVHSPCFRSRSPSRHARRSSGCTHPRDRCPGSGRCRRLLRGRTREWRSSRSPDDGRGEGAGAEGSGEEGSGEEVAEGDS